MIITLSIQAFILKVKSYINRLEVKRFITSLLSLTNQGGGYWEKPKDTIKEKNLKLSNIKTTIFGADSGRASMKALGITTQIEAKQNTPQSTSNRGAGTISSRNEVRASLLNLEAAKLSSQDNIMEETNELGGSNRGHYSSRKNISQFRPADH